jgi:hypothetical protein
VSKEKSRNSRAKEGERTLEGESKPYQVRLPGFLIKPDEDMGLGDTIQHVTSTYFGIKPCDNCGRRAEALNRRVRFTSRTMR